MCFGIKRKCNERDNEAETSQHNMQAKDERSGFPSKPLGVSYLRKGARGRRGSAERRPKEGGVGVSVPEFLWLLLTSLLPYLHSPSAHPERSPAEWVLF